MQEQSIPQFTGEQLQTIYALEQIVGAPDHGRVDCNARERDETVLELRREGFHVGFVTVSDTGMLRWVP